MDVPDLQAMAKDNDPAATLAMCRLTIAIAVQSARNKEIIDKIQALSQEDQHCLMKAIEQVCDNWDRVLIRKSAHFLPWLVDVET